MTAYYNEIDPYAAQWLRNLIDAGHIARGVVDTRSIEDIRPRDLDGFTQCHFFAGIGVWSYALRLAGWPDDRPVWTGSCPCQPFSSAGKGAGFDDERHLWPHWYWLIGERRPAIIFGEQVASRDADDWIDLVSDDLEGLDYAIGAVPFPSAGVGAPHIRDRLYWMAYADGARLQGWRGHTRGTQGTLGRRDADARGGHPGRLEHANNRSHRSQEPPADHRQPQANGSADFVSGPGLSPSRVAMPTDQSAGPTNGFWRSADWIGCRDGKWRPVEPGTFPLAHGAPARVGRLRGYGNAINAQAAATFIQSSIGATP